MRFLWSSDHHTLHQTTPTSHVLNNLSTFLIKDNDLAKTDMIVFGGDFMDRLVESPNPDMFLVSEWVRMFLDKCQAANKDMTIIWLEGTSSHDWGQPKNFLNLVPTGLDVRYIDTISIDVYPKYNNLSILHVPDNMGALTPDEIWAKTLDVLTRHSLTKVDLIFFHGGFDFQLHPKARHKAHDLDRWSSIVKYGIFAGHIHVPVQKGKLYTSGSFDRNRHGEEHPKGGYIVDLDKARDVFIPVFYENKKALPYISIRVDEAIKPEELLKTIHSFIKKKGLMRNSQICIKGGSASIVNPILNVIAKEYPQYGFKADNESTSDAKVTEELFDASIYEGSTLTKENLIDSVYPEIKDRVQTSGLKEGFVLDVLKEFL